MNTYRGSATMAQLMMSELQWPDEVRHLICTPLSHAGSSLFVPLQLQGAAMFVLPTFDAGAVLEAIERHRITTTMLVPSMIYALLDHPRFDRDRPLEPADGLLRGVGHVAGAPAGGDQEAGADLRPVLRADRGAHDGVRPAQGGPRRRRPRDDSRRAAARCRGCRSHCSTTTATRFPQGEPGELCVRGPLVMKGYWNKPEETAAAFEHGWLHTGDVCREDDDGFFTIVDRKKDMIVSGGFNIFPREVEDVISTHPSVAAVAVIGVPDETWGEAVKAVVVPRSGQTVDVEELIALVKQQKGSHHAPKSVDIVDSIPVSAVGKPDKKALRARYWAGSDRLVH